MNIISNIFSRVKKDVFIKIIIILAIVVVGALLIGDFSGLGGKSISAKAAGEKTVAYINANFLQGKDQATFKEVTSVSGMYKVKFTYQNIDNEIYITKDGKYLFPTMQGVPIEMKDGETAEQADANTNANANANANNTAEEPKAKSCDQVAKQANPAMMAFVVSQCPFGLQMQRALAETIKAVPALSANIAVKYMFTSQGADKFSAMHGEKEYQENLKQICIREEQSAKYWQYVSCYIKKGDTAGCLSSTGVDQAKLNSCVSDSNKGLKYVKADYALQQQFNVTGSPTLILNNDLVSEYSFGGRTADALKSVACCGFSNQPAFCSQALNKDAAASGFSETYKSSSQTNNQAECGS